MHICRVPWMLAGTMPPQNKQTRSRCRCCHLRVSIAREIRIQKPSQRHTNDPVRTRNKSPGASFPRQNFFQVPGGKLSAAEFFFSFVNRDSLNCVLVRCLFGRRKSSSQRCIIDIDAYMLPGSAMLSKIKTSVPLLPPLVRPGMFDFMFELSFRDVSVVVRLPSGLVRVSYTMLLLLEYE